MAGRKDLSISFSFHVNWAPRAHWPVTLWLFRRFQIAGSSLSVTLERGNLNKAHDLTRVKGVFIQKRISTQNVYRQMTPPQNMMDNPANAVTTKFVRASTNKMRCPIFCCVVSIVSPLSLAIARFHVIVRIFLQSGHRKAEGWLRAHLAENSLSGTAWRSISRPYYK